MLLSDIVSINRIIGRRDNKHFMMVPIKTITSIWNVSTYIITSITACSIELPAILVIMSVSTAISAVILYVPFLRCCNVQVLASHVAVHIELFTIYSIQIFIFSQNDEDDFITEDNISPSNEKFIIGSLSKTPTDFMEYGTSPGFKHFQDMT